MVSNSWPVPSMACVVERVAVDGDDEEVNDCVGERRPRAGRAELAHALPAPARDDVRDAVDRVEPLVVVVVAGQHERHVVSGQDRHEPLVESRVVAVLARRVRRLVAVHDRPGQLVRGQIGFEPGSLRLAAPLGVEHDEVNVPPVVRVPALDAGRAAVLGQHEHLPEGCAVVGVVLVVSARREDRPLREDRRVDTEKPTLELGQQTVVVRNVAQVNQEVERNGLELLEQRALVAAAAARISERDELHAPHRARRRRALERRGRGDRLAVLKDGVAVGRVRLEAGDGCRPLEGAAGAQHAWLHHRRKSLRLRAVRPRDEDRRRRSFVRGPDDDRLLRGHPLQVRRARQRLRVDCRLRLARNARARDVAVAGRHARDRRRAEIAGVIGGEPARLVARTARERQGKQGNQSDQGPRDARADARRRVLHGPRD